MQNTIALVDDDINITKSLSILLENEGYKTLSYYNGDDAFTGLSQRNIDLAWVDLKMPRLNGIELLEKLRPSNTTPVIFLTSTADELDEVLCLHMGADDYITKPFSQRILIERIKVVLRRYDISEEYETHYKNKKVVRGSLSLDPVKHICKWNGDPVNLTVSEFSILNALAKFPGHVKTREQLLDIIYDDNIYVEDRNIDSHIKRIRKKFLMVDRSFRNIETVYGLGYRYRSI